MNKTSKYKKQTIKARKERILNYMLAHIDYASKLGLSEYAILDIKTHWMDRTCLSGLGPRSNEEFEWVRDNKYVLEDLGFGVTLAPAATWRGGDENYHRYLISWE